MSESWRFDAIGTVWEIRTESVLSTDAVADVTRIIDGFDRTWSRFRPDSLVTALAATEGSVPAPAQTREIFDAYAELAAATDGAVTPFVGEALARRGYDAALSLVDRGASPARAWPGGLVWSDDVLQVDPPALLDIGALGKGLLVDLVFDALSARTDGDVVVDASGDLRVRGSSERVGLEHPFDPSRAIGVVALDSQALCASAINRRAWGDGLHHVLDARTGEPVRSIAATWALADTAMRADAAATALFFDGGPRLAHEWGVEWVRMTTDGHVQWSPGSKAELFL